MIDAVQGELELGENLNVKGDVWLMLNVRAVGLTDEQKLCISMSTEDAGYVVDAFAAIARRAREIGILPEKATRERRGYFWGIAQTRSVCMTGGFVFPIACSLLDRREVVALAQWLLASQVAAHRRGRLRATSSPILSILLAGLPRLPVLGGAAMHPYA